MADPLDPKVMDSVNEAILAGRIIEAIKLYRQATNSGLAEAKTFVDGLEARLRAQMPERFTAPPRQTVEVRLTGCLLLVAALAVAVGLLFWLVAS